MIFNIIFVMLAGLFYLYLGGLTLVLGVVLIFSGDWSGLWAICFSIPCLLLGGYAALATYDEIA